MKILVTGANGQLGRELLKCSNNLGFVSVGLGFFAIAWVFNALKGRV